MKLKAWVVSIILVLVALSCSGKDSTPTSPSSEIEMAPVTIAPAGTNSQENHYSLGIWWAIISSDHTSVELVPLRTSDIHLNAVKLLEVAPCTDCLTIGSISIPSPNEIWVDILIKHPFETNLNLTVFDPRLVFITGSDFEFPEMGRAIANGTNLPHLLNADGHTTLFNPTEFPYESSLPDILKYYPGKLSTGGDLSATLNPYLAYSQDSPRRMLLPGEEETRTVKLSIPEGEFQFGTAVDICWVNPGIPVTDPETDFPPEANCVEPYQVTISITEQIISVTGSSSPVIVGVTDHQGLDTVGEVTIEVPGLFAGLSILEFLNSDGDDFGIYKGTITNTLDAEAGIYPVLVSVQSVHIDPIHGQINAYTVEEIEVIYTDGFPVALATHAPSVQAVTWPVYFIDNGSYDPDGGELVNYEWDWDNDGIYDEEGAEVSHSWDTPGTYYVQFRVTDDESEIGELEKPIEIQIIENSFSASEIDLRWMTRETWSSYLEGQCLAISDGGYGLHLYDLADKTNPQWVTYIETSYIGFPHQIASSDGYMFVAGYYEDASRFYVIDVDPPQDTYLVNTIDISPGWACSITIEGDLAYIGMQDYGVILVDISYPEFPEQIGHLPEIYPSDAIEFYGDYVLTGGELFGSVVLYEIVQPDEFTLIDIFHLEGNTIKMEIENENLFILGSMIMIYDINLPTTIQNIAQVNNTGYDFELANGYLYAFWQKAFNIYNVDPPETTELVKSIELQTYGYNVEVTDGYAYLTDNGCQAWIIDIDPIEDSHVAKKIYSMSRNPDDIEKEGNFLYVLSGSVFSNGYLHVVDVSNPYQPEIINNLIMPINCTELILKGGFAYTAGKGRFIVMDISTPGSETIVANIQTGPDSDALGIDNDIACVQYDDMYGDNGFRVLDITDPYTPQVGGIGWTDGYPSKVRVKDGYAYVAESFGADGLKLSIWDVDPPENPIFIQNVELDGIRYLYPNGVALALSTSHAYITGEVNDEVLLNIVDISQPGSAELANVVNLGESDIQEIKIVGNLAYLIGNSFMVLDLSDPEAPVFIEENASISGRSSLVDNGYIYVAEYGLRIWETN